MGEGMQLIFALFMNRIDHYMTGKEIQETLEAEGHHYNVKTIYNYIRQINAFFEPYLHQDMIVSIHRKGWSLNQDYFDDGQLQLLIDAISYNKDLSSQEKNTMIEKLLNLSSFNQKQRLIIHQENEEKPFSLMVNLSVIMKAVEKKRNISFQYVDYAIENGHPKETPSQYGNKGETYVVSPYTIVLDNNHYYMIGYFNKREDSLSMYRIDRMRKVMTVKGNYIDITEQYNIDDYIAHSFNMFIGGRQTDIVFLFHRDIIREMVSRFGEDIDIIQLNNHWYRTIIRDQTYSRGLLSWIMMLGSKIIVESPSSIRDDIKREVQKTFNHYQK